MTSDREYVPRVVRRPEADHYYYAVKCPVTAQMLLFEEDESRGTRPFPRFASFLVSCHHCQSTHQFSDPEVSSLRQPETE
jgi:hypothetical protein